MIKRGEFKLFKGKRGMSPLIATVLLIAFAVAMGAMIMNWSSSIGESSGPDCSGIRMVMNPVICYSNNAIKINIKNQGPEISGLTVKIIDSSVENEISLKDSRLEKGDAISRELPFIKTSQTYVGVVPIVMYKGSSEKCKAPSLEVKELKEC